MKLASLTRLKRALDLMGVDNGANVNGDADIPNKWVWRCQVADDQLAKLADEQIETLAMGEESEMEAVAVFAGTAHEVMCAAFDGGPLERHFFTPWTGIHDARAAEARVLR